MTRPKHTIEAPTLHTFMSRHVFPGDESLTFAHLPCTPAGPTRARGGDVEIRTVAYADNHDAHAPVGALGGPAVQDQAGARLSAPGRWAGAMLGRVLLAVVCYHRVSEKAEMQCVTLASLSCDAGGHPRRHGGTVL